MSRAAFDNLYLYVEHKYYGFIDFVYLISLEDVIIEGPNADYSLKVYDM